jgi:hypothetical protein
MGGIHKWNVLFQMVLSVSELAECRWIYEVMNLVIFMAGEIFDFRKVQKGQG